MKSATFFHGCRLFSAADDERTRQFRQGVPESRESGAKVESGEAVQSSSASIHHSMIKTRCKNPISLLLVINQADSILSRLLMPIYNEKNGLKDLRNKQVLAGLFLSRFDNQGLDALGFSSFTEAFNTIGLALGARPASIKNYRDEFDPIYSSKRKGWRNRPMREYCKIAGEKYAGMTLNEFSIVLKSLIYERGELDIFAEDTDSESNKEASFAKRLITGQAAEKYFEVMHPNLPLFADYTLENVTKLGCGFDYQLRKQDTDDFLAIEVKGLNAQRGTISLTEKEHRVAGALSQRFYLFVVSNFRETPSHAIYCDPLKSELIFSRQETQIVHVNWRVSV